MRLRALVLCVRSSASEMSLAACSWAKLPFHDSVPGYKCSPVGIFGSAKESDGARSLMCCDGFFGSLITTVATSCMFLWRI